MRDHRPLILGLDAVHTLNRMGISTEHLHQSFLRAHRHSAPCNTAWHPHALHGENMSGWLIYYLREGLVPKGWTLDRHGNCDLTVRPDNTLALDVLSGDSSTGHPRQIPSMRNRRGPVTKNVISMNQQVLDGFEPVPSSAREVWVLLYCVDPIARKIRFEVSLPTRMAGDWRRIAWFQRIIPGPIALEPVPEADGPTVPDIDVPVVRRAA